MAEGDITRDTGSPGSMGNYRVLTGTIEVGPSLTAFQLLNNSVSSIVSCNVDCEDGIGSAKVRINEDASGTATLGSIAVQGDDVTVRTYRYQCVFAGL